MDDLPVSQAYRKCFTLELTGKPCSEGKKNMFMVNVSPNLSEFVASEAKRFSRAVDFAHCLHLFVNLKYRDWAKAKILQSPMFVDSPLLLSKRNFRAAIMPFDYYSQGRGTGRNTRWKLRSWIPVIIVDLFCGSLMEV